MTATPRSNPMADQEFAESLLADYIRKEMQLRRELMDQAIRLSVMQRSRDRWRTAFWLLLSTTGVFVPVLVMCYVR